MNWRFLWEVCLVGALSLFAIMSIVVTIGGAKDIRRLLRRLEKTNKEDE